jgi:hypothetical protein
MYTLQDRYRQVRRQLRQLAQSFEAIGQAIRSMMPAGRQTSPAWAWAPARKLNGQAEGWRRTLTEVRY